MPKPTRRERRKLAEQGKLAPRRPKANVIERSTAVVEPRESISTPRPITPKPVTAKSEQPVAVSDTNEYAYVKADLLRILLLAGTLVGAMVALKFVLPP